MNSHQVTECLGPGYQIVRQLSSGSMSDVYEAIEVRLNRRVALKVLPPSKSLVSGAVDRFLREARTTAKLEKHPNIVCVFNIGQENGLHFFTTSFAGGETLRQRMERQGRMPVAEAVGIVKQLLDALQFIHASGFVHCDIKPENLLFDEDDRLIVTDFGISRNIRAPMQEDSGLVIGTPSCMSPEQASGCQITPSSDLYSVGILLYELLAGELPFDAQDLTALLMKQVYELPMAISRKVPGIPLELSSLLDQLLQKDPSLRPASAQAALDTLGALGNCQFTMVRPVSLEEPWKQAYELCRKVIQEVAVPMATGFASAVVEPALRVFEPVNRRTARTMRLFKHFRLAAVAVLCVLTGMALVEIQDLLVASASPAPAAAASVGNTTPQRRKPDVSQDAANALPDAATRDGKTKPATGDSTTTRAAAETTDSVPNDNPVDVNKPETWITPTVAKPRSRQLEIHPGRHTSLADRRPRPANSLPDRTNSLIEASDEPKDAIAAVALTAARKAASKAATMPVSGPAHSTGQDGFVVEHDHVAGNCRGRLILQTESLFFVSEKKKDSRQWDYSQIHKLIRKGTDMLEFSTSEKDSKKLGFQSRTYRFRILEPQLSSDTFEQLLTRTSQQ